MGGGVASMGVWLRVRYAAAGGEASPAARATALPGACSSSPLSQLCISSIVQMVPKKNDMHLICTHIAYQGKIVIVKYNVI